MGRGFFPEEEACCYGRGCSYCRPYTHQSGYDFLDSVEKTEDEVIFSAESSIWQFLISLLKSWWSEHSR